MYGFSLIIFGFQQWNYDTAAAIKQVHEFRQNSRGKNYVEEQIKISTVFRNIYPDSTIIYLTKLLKNKELTNKQINEINHNISIAYFNKQEFELAFFYSNKVKEFKEDVKLRQDYIVSLILRFEIYYNNLEYDSALFLGDKILRLKYIDDKSKYRIKNKIAAYYVESLQNTLALQAYNEIEKYLLKIKDYHWLSEVYLNKANIYQGINTDSLEYFAWKSIDMGGKYNAPNNQIYSYLILAQNELELNGDNKKFRDYLESAEKLARKNNLIQELALIYFMSLEFEVNQNQFKNKARLSELVDSIEIYMNNNISLSLKIKSYSSMVNVYEHLGNLSKALSTSYVLIEHYKKSYIEKSKSSIESFSKINQLYVDQERLFEAEKLLTKKQRKIYYLIITISVLAAIFLLFYLKFSLKSMKKSTVQKIKSFKEREFERNIQLVNQYQTDIALLNAKHDEKLKSIRRQVLYLKEELGETFEEKFKGIDESFGISMNNESTKLSEHFNNIYPDFTRKILAISNEMTHNDLKICMMIKLNMSTKEMAEVLSQSVRTIESTRYRLRRKLKLDSKENLGNFLMNL